MLLFVLITDCILFAPLIIFLQAPARFVPDGYLCVSCPYGGGLVSDIAFLLTQLQMSKIKAPYESKEAINASPDFVRCLVVLYQSLRIKDPAPLARLKVVYSVFHDL